ncbi:MAG TPA: hypothetical protein VLX85_04675 [Stellaceae bacterium]|nr:hypothetical protein [Stellaceae bacterium]
MLLAVGTGAVARAGDARTLRVGDANGANVAFVFQQRAKPPAIVLHTTRIGVAGSRIEITVDEAKKPVFAHVLAPGECKFGDAGSACQVTILAKDPACRAILARFKRGHRARVTLQDAGVMKMDETASLAGLAKALR